MEISAPIENGFNLSPVYQLQPFDLALKGEVQVGIRYERDLSEHTKLGIYYFEPKKEKIVKFSEVESAPFYIDWCTSNIAVDKIRECTDSGIKLFAKQNFNTGLANELKLSGFQRITSAFTIDKNGDIINIRVRATHPRLEEEAIRVINLLPKMEPGRQNGKAISISYLLPIIFKVERIKEISYMSINLKYAFYAHCRK
mgnify:CR=1 FL=1